MTTPPHSSVPPAVDCSAVWKTYVDGDRARSYKFLEVFTRPPVVPLLAQSGLIWASDTDAFETMSAIEPETETPPTPGPFIVLDNACGTGVVAAVLLGPTAASWDDLESTEKVKEIVCGDLSAEMVDLTTVRSQRHGWEREGKVKVRVEVIDAQDTKLPEGYFSHVLMNFGMMYVQDPVLTLKEHLRIVKPGGTVAFTTWNMLGWYPYLRRAAERIPSLPPLLTPFSIWRRDTDAPSTESSSSSLTSDFMPDNKLFDSAEWVATLLPTLGFVDVTVTPFQFDSELRGKSQREEFVKSCEGLLLPLFASRWTEEQKGMIPLIGKELDKVMREEFGDPEDPKVTASIPSIAIISSGRKPL